MSAPWRVAKDERGVALPVALMVLTILGALVAGYLTLGAVEPQISQNLTDGARARFVAEAGIEWSFNYLAGKDFSTLLLGADGVAGSADDTIPSGVGALSTSIWLVQNQPVPGRAAAEGTFSVAMRNDSAPAASGYTGDQAITGLAAIDAGGHKVDTNGIVVVTSTSTLLRGGQTTTRTIQAVIRRSTLNINAALSLPGLQADTFVGNTNFEIDGRDYRRADAWGALGASVPTGTGPMKFGVATQPGIQANIAPTTYEQNAENGFDTAAKKALVKGKNQTTGAYTTGDTTVAADTSLSPTVMADFLAEVASNPATTVIQSSLACPLVLTGSTGTPTSSPTLSTTGSGSCPGSPPVGSSLNLGTPADPKLVYFRGDLDSSSGFTGLRMNNRISGAGILIVEDGDWQVYGDNFQWDGIVIVTGRYVGMGFRTGSGVKISGALVGMEAISGEAGGFFEFLTQSNSLQIRSSKENRDMALSMLANQRILNWREDVKCAGCS